MPLAVRRRRAARTPVAAVACLLIAGYFAHHAVSGKHGLEARSKLQERAKRIGGEAKALQIQLQRLQRDVALLSADPPDTDLVRETAADIIGFVPADGLLAMATKSPGR